MPRTIRSLLIAVFSILFLIPTPLARAQDACTIEAFRAGFNHRIPAESWTEYDPTTDPAGYLGRPGFYIAKSMWTDFRINGADGNRVEAFPDVTSRERWEAYLHAFDGTILTQGYIYARNTMLVLVDRRYTPDQAEEFAAILAESCP